MSNKHRIFVLILALNERESLPEMLAELPKDDIDEIVAIDGHSTDGTPELVRELGYRAVAQEGKGCGMGVISGIKAAQGDLLSFVDADGSYVPVGWCGSWRSSSKVTISFSAPVTWPGRGVTTTPSSAGWVTRYSRPCCA